jgi:glycine cleavage system H protein
VAFNEDLADDPSGLNSDPYTTWIFRIVPDAFDDIDTLLDAGAYSSVANG